ncbi:SAM-dependent methyltransferase [Paeniglutamicibacter antarcticus]|uniref:SAM-dependent methyltransferase n=1 Tax=Arthrobacter terrae TaxID=2935737 RepID=A0A931GAB5_9MICC|nr:SAM-dependent methyltransferase [Arthrobacter terrae]MBG0739557.1 SAM-dependent methyltransferase [Arthrobacter terrae]
MNRSGVAALLCPLCAGSFAVDLTAPAKPTALVCDSGHSFDIAKQGYVNFLTGPGTRFIPDSAAMAAARDEFLAAGHYLPLAQALATTILAISPGGGDPLVVDAGTGTGYYLNQLHRAAAEQTRSLGLANEPAGSAPASIGLDISKFALRRAARLNPDTVNVVWDVWQPLPIAAGTADVVIVVFAPRNPAEFARILKPRGALVVATPLPGHLAEIVGAAGLLGMQEDKQSALQASLAAHFAPGGITDVAHRLSLSPEDVFRIALMGPSGHHLDPVQLRDRVAALPQHTEVTARFRISTFCPHHTPAT